MRPFPESAWRALVRYLTGESDPEETESLQTWIVEEQERARLMDELTSVWTATDETPRRRDVEAAWQSVSEQLGDPPATSRGQNPGYRWQETAPRRHERGATRHSTAHRAARTKRGRHALWRVAAVVLATAVLTLLGAELLGTGAPAEGVAGGEAGKVFATGRGQRATVRLLDGTVVRLNAESRLVLPPGGFGPGRRAVYLEGEAYFEVTSDEGRPFVVRTGGAAIRVVGTAFDVRAYGDEKLRVAVVEGTVAVHPGAAAPQEKVALRSHQVAHVAGGQLQGVRKATNLAPYVGWTDGTLVFEDTPFGEVARELERWFGIEIEVRVRAGQIDRLNATFPGTSLAQVLKATAAALNLQYVRRDSGTVIFFRGRANVPRRSASDRFQLTK